MITFTDGLVIAALVEMVVIVAAALGSLWM
jgi:hypothetical protein